MASIILTKRTAALAAPALVFLCCALIVYSGLTARGEGVSLALVGDMVITAPLLFWALSRRSGFSRWAVLRVVMVGIVVAGVLLPKGSSPEVLSVLEHWVYPVLEVGLVAFVVQRFVQAKRRAKDSDTEVDFLQHCRSVLTAVLGSKGAGSVLASEVAVFYYAVAPKRKAIVEGERHFSTYKGNGIRLVLGTFLGLFVVEAAAMHFLFMLWSHTAAWVLTGLSLYSCLQLFAHIRALALRPVVISGGYVYLRNGLLGGEATLPLELIARAEESRKDVTAPGTQKLALLKGLEKHNTALYLKEPIEIIKAFGIRRTASVLLLSIDNHHQFIAALQPAPEA